MSNQGDFLIKQILEEITVLKSKMPNGELKRVQDGVEELKKSFSQLKDDVSDLKKKLLDPDDGVIVKVNENTKFRLQEETKSEENMQTKIDINDLKKWQNGVNKALWIIFAALAGIAIKLIFSIKSA